MRRLARGVMPPILTEAGLAAAVESLAERAPIPVVVAVPDRRFPQSIETAAYYVVTEALTNAVRYAAASEVRIDGRVVDGRLVVSVTDDGRGGADPERDRPPRAGRPGRGGRREPEVESRLGEGTRVRATFPQS